MLSDHPAAPGMAHVAEQPPPRSTAGEGRGVWLNKSMPHEENLSMPLSREASYFIHHLSDLFRKVGSYIYFPATQHDGYHIHTE